MRRDKNRFHWEKNVSPDFLLAPLLPGMSAPSLRDTLYKTIGKTVSMQA